MSFLPLFFLSLSLLPIFWSLLTAFACMPQSYGSFLPCIPPPTSILHTTHPDPFLHLTPRLTFTNREPFWRHMYHYYC